MGCTPNRNRETDHTDSNQNEETIALLLLRKDATVCFHRHVFIIGYDHLRGAIRVSIRLGVCIRIAFEHVGMPIDIQAVLFVVVSSMAFTHDDEDCGKEEEAVFFLLKEPSTVSGLLLLLLLLLLVVLLVVLPLVAIPLADRFNCRKDSAPSSHELIPVGASIYGSS